MKSFRVVVAGLVLTLAPAVPVLAYASPPDPSWIPGIYDDADSDDVVTLVVSGAGKILPVAPVDVPFIPRFVGGDAHFPEAAPEPLDAPAVHSRAPPAA
jgi:hypothetical protein